MKKPRHFLENFSASFSSISLEVWPLESCFLHPSFPSQWLPSLHCRRPLKRLVLCLCFLSLASFEETCSYIVSVDNHSKLMGTDRNTGDFSTVQMMLREQKPRNRGSSLASDLHVSVSWSSIIVN